MLSQVAPAPRPARNSDDHSSIEKVDAVALAELAAQAQVDRRTMRKALDGHSIRGLAGARIRRVLREHASDTQPERRVPPTPRTNIESRRDERT